MENFKLSNELSWPLKDLVNGKWNKVYKIDKNAPFYFKFNDNHKIIKNLQTRLKENDEAKKLFSYQHIFGDELKKIKLWLKSEENIIQMSMYDIYSGLLKHLKDHSYEDQLFNSNEVSFIGPLGPFKHMALIECLNDELIDKFIFSQIIKNKLPSRKLRIHTRGKVRIEFGEEFDTFANIEIKQITDSGILFSSKDDLLLETVSKSQFIKFFVDTRMMNQFLENNLEMPNDANEDFFFTKDHLRYFFIEEVNVVKSLSYKSGVTNEVFLFCRYHHMLESDVPNIFHEFTQKVKDYFQELF